MIDILSGEVCPLFIFGLGKKKYFGRDGQVHTFLKKKPFKIIYKDLRIDASVVKRLLNEM